MCPAIVVASVFAKSRLSFPRWGLPQDCVGVRPAEAEGVNASSGRTSTLRPRLNRLWHAQLESTEWDLGVGRLKVQVGRYLTVIKGQSGLDQSRDARGRLQVADVRFDGAEQARAVCGTAGG